ncbi:MAG: hypothetical protein QXY49_05085 [Thermofilaceae archaeon]
MKTSECPGFSYSLLPYYAVGLTASPQLISTTLLSSSDLIEVINPQDIKVTGPGEFIVDEEVHRGTLLVSIWPEPDIGARKCLNLKNPESAKLLRECLHTEKHVTVIGSIAALPLIDALLKAGFKQLYFYLDKSAKIFDNDIQEQILKNLTECGVKLIDGLDKIDEKSLIVSYAWGKAPQPIWLSLKRGSRIIVDRFCNVMGIPGIKAIGCATKIVGQKGYKFDVTCEGESMLQAQSCFLDLIGLEPVNIKRCFIAQLGDKLFASLGMLPSEAESLGRRVSVTKIRGWGAWSETSLKIVASQKGKLLGIQLITSLDKAMLIGFLYCIVRAEENLRKLLYALNPLAVFELSFEDPFHRALQALFRKIVLRALAKRSQIQL